MEQDVLVPPPEVAMQTVFGVYSSKKAAMILAAACVLSFCATVVVLIETGI